jgi:hypothetical protein
MPPLTPLVHGSIPVDEKDAGGVDSAEVGVGRRDDGVEASFGRLRDVLAALPRPRIGVHDDDVPAHELERPRMDPRESELEHAPGSVAQQLEDAGRRRGGESGWQAHGYSPYMSEKGTGKFLGVPYDWRRPTVARVKSRWWNDDDKRIFTPKSYGWGFDVNVAQVLRRLRLRG